MALTSRVDENLIANILIALTQKTNLNQANLNQVLAIFCQIDGFNGADFFVHPCVIFYDSLHAIIM